MNEYKKFIKRLGEGESGMVQVSSQHVKQMFPELFQVKFEKSKWYKHIVNGSIVCYVGGDEGYGFSSSGDWFDNDTGAIGLTSKWTPATNEVVEEMLIKEAKKRFGKNRIVDLSNRKDEGVLTYDSSEFYPDELWLMPKIGVNMKVFDNGKWATIIEQPLEQTMEQVSELTIGDWYTVAELKELGYKVKIVK